MMRVTKDVFLILDNKNNILSVEDSHKNKYSVKVFQENSHFYNPGRSVDGMIYPWGEHYRFSGIVKVRISNEELVRWFFQVLILLLEMLQIRSRSIYQKN